MLCRLIWDLQHYLRGQTTSQYSSQYVKILHKPFTFSPPQWTTSCRAHESVALFVADLEIIIKSSSLSVEEIDLHGRGLSLSLSLSGSVGLQSNNEKLQKSLCPPKQGIKLKGYYPYFGVQPFTFPSKYFATLQNGRGNFL